MKLEDMYRAYDQAYLDGNMHEMDRLTVAIRKLQAASIASPDNNNFELFEDRVKSLLVRWRDYANRHPQINQEIVVKACLSEISDDFTKQLMGE